MFAHSGARRSENDACLELLRRVVWFDDGTCCALFAVDSPAHAFVAGDRGRGRIGCTPGLFRIFREKWRVYRTRGWPTSQGTVGNIRPDKVSGGANGVDYWKVKFDYTYKVQQEHTHSFSIICATENLANRASAGLKDKTVSVHYKPSDENKAMLWEDEVFNIWWDASRQP